LSINDVEKKFSGVGTTKKVVKYRLYLQILSTLLTFGEGYEFTNKGNYLYILNVNTKETPNILPWEHLLGSMVGSWSHAQTLDKTVKAC
jgi:hypothetical protein